MSKLVYIANIRLPTEKAHGIQIMEMCQAFKKNGVDVELLIPNRSTPIKDDLFKYYDIETKFPVKKLFCIELLALGKLMFWVETLSFSFSVFLYSLFRTNTIFYTRDRLPALILKLLGEKVILEEHYGHKNKLISKLISLNIPIVVITEALKDLYLGMGAKNEQILVAADGVDVDRFDIDVSRSDAREKLTLPQDKKIVLYKGHLYAWKGAGTLAQTAPLLNKDIQLVFIGGTEADVVEFKNNYGKYENVSILGNRPRKETPIYQKAADLLVIPNSAKEDVSKLFTSPMKMFGYMAGGVPIVASDLPSLREVLSEDTAYFFKPDDEKDLARVIQDVFNNYETAKGNAVKALEKVRKYSWRTRAQNIINFIS